MNKNKVKSKILKDGKETYLSAQDYNILSKDERNLIKIVLKEEKKDPDEYERRMRKMWPKIWVPKPTVWRHR